MLMLLTVKCVSAIIAKYYLSSYPFPQHDDILATIIVKMWIYISTHYTFLKKALGHCCHNCRLVVKILGWTLADWIYSASNRAIQVQQ